MRKAYALALLLVLAACHRGNVADVTLDADRAAENATAAKTLGDIAAAEEASRTPLPGRRTETPAAAPDRSDEPPMPEPDDVISDGNSGDASPQ